MLWNSKSYPKSEYIVLNVYLKKRGNTQKNLVLITRNYETKETKDYLN